MAPRLTLVKLSGGINLRKRADATARHFDSLTTQIVQLVDRVELTSGLNRTFHHLPMGTIRNLTHFHIKFDGDGEKSMRLVRQNVPTLQCLSILSRVDANLSGIIEDDDGGFVEYARLHTLLVELGYGLDKSWQYTSTSAVPFPNLRRLGYGGGFPFSAGPVLLRGNAATLEFLSLILTRDLVLDLLRCNLFTPTSHPKLQCVVLELPLSMRSVNYTDDPAIIQFMMDIAPGAAVRKISKWPLDQASHPPVLSLLSNHASLQVLALPDLRLSIWDAMTLIQALPLLSDLYGKTLTLAPMPIGVTKRKLVEYVCSNYSPMGTQFRSWYFGDEDSRDLKDTVKPFLLLALACPNFDCIFIPRNGRVVFMKLM
ncbi:hypothetical protein GGH93_003660 [Coemansia aciculifera]|nr:hypothetical protein GGH93_003660 [Coemansia aciculifera]